MDDERTELEINAYDSIEMSNYEYDSYSYLNEYENDVDSDHTIKDELNENNHFAYATWLMDVTGWRLIDEIFHISAYMPNSQFSNYILPQCNLNTYTQRLYKLKVITQMNGYRMLKNLKNNQIIKTKTENCVLIDFLTWLEDNRGDNDGIILITYEKNEKMPVILLAALEKNQLLDRFMSVVKGFANMYDIINDKENSFDSLIKSFEQKSESSMLTKIWYDLLLKLIVIHKDTSGEGENIELIFRVIVKVLKSTHEQIGKLSDVTTDIQKKNAWKPLFCDALVSGRRNRLHAAHLRKALVDKDVDFETLKSTYETGGKDAVYEALLKFNISELTSKNIAQLVDCYFNSENRIILPKIWSTSETNRAMSKNLYNKGRKMPLKNESDVIPGTSNDEI